MHKGVCCAKIIIRTAYVSCISISGGIFACFRHYADMVRKKMITPPMPPVYGSLACQQWGVTLTEEVWKWFIKQYIDGLKSREKG